MVIYARAGVIIRRMCSSRSNLPRLTLFTKNPCPLCDEAMEELRSYQHRVGKMDIYSSLLNWHYNKKHAWEWMGEYAEIWKK